MDPRIADIERAALFAWPAAHIQELDGWKLRFHWNLTGRANSAWPNETTGTLSLEERIDRVSHFYHGRLLPARYQVSPASCPQELDDVLEARAYRFQAGASVQIQRMDALLVRTREEIERTDREADEAGGRAAAPNDGKNPVRELTVEVLQRPNDAWFVVQQGALAMEAKWAGLRRSLIQEIASRSAASSGAGFALCRVDGEPAAIGIGVIAGEWLGIFGMATVPESRRRGAAVRAMEALANWADGRASSIYLQVFPENHPALALYAKLGFKQLYMYHYRVEPWQV